MRRIAAIILASALVLQLAALAVPGIPVLAASDASSSNSTEKQTETKAADEKSATKGDEASGQKSSDEVVHKKTITGPSEEKVEVTLRRQLAYGLTLFDGASYQGTFCPEAIDTIYIVANTQNIFTVNKTDVYFWPITKEYMADWMGINELQKGKLEILKGGKVIKTLSLEKYTLRYPMGYMSDVAELKLGEEAIKAAEDYKKRMDAFYDAQLKYYDDYDKYLKQVEAFIKNPKAFKNQPPKEPKQPTPPEDYVMDAQDAFIVNLPAGTYRIRFKDEKGKVVPKTERKLVSFPVLNTGTGYQVIPEEKWTRPTTSDDLSENIFALRNRVIFLVPFEALQYNAHHYTKLSMLSSPTSGRGLENQTKWVHTNQIKGKGHILEVLRGGKVIAKVEEKPYYIKQRPGYALGYDVVEFNEKEYPGTQPTFTAYKVDIPALSKGAAARFTLRLVDKDGKVVKGSVRNLRISRQPRLLVLLAASLIPLLAGLAVVGVRMSKTRRVAPKATPLPA